MFSIIICGYVLYYTTKANSKQTVLKPVAMQFEQTCYWSDKCACLTGKSQICETEGKENSVHNSVHPTLPTINVIVYWPRLWNLGYWVTRRILFENSSLFQYDYDTLIIRTCKLKI